MNKKSNKINIETPEEFQKRIDKELGYKLEYFMKKMRNEKERMEMLNEIREYARLLDNVQELDHYVRLYFWQAAVAIFDYLRQSDALGRQSAGFADHVAKNILESTEKAFYYASQQ